MKEEIDKQFIEEHQREIDEIKQTLADLRESKTLMRAYKKFYKKTKNHITYNNKNLSSNKFNALMSRKVESKVELKPANYTCEMNGRFC